MRYSSINIVLVLRVSDWDRYAVKLPQLQFAVIFSPLRYFPILIAYFSFPCIPFEVSRVALDVLYSAGESAE